MCSETGVALESLEHPAEAAVWYGKAVQLATLIASDEMPLVLHTLLRRGDLEELVTSINQSAMKLLKLDPDFNAFA